MRRRGNLKISASRPRSSSETTGEGDTMLRPLLNRHRCLEYRAAVLSEDAGREHREQFLDRSACRLRARRRSTLRVWTREMDDHALQHTCRATVVARLMYAAGAWSGLTKEPDRKRIYSVLDRARRRGYCPSCVTLPKTNSSAEPMRLSNHVLPALIPPQSSICIAEIQPQTSHTLTTAAITHHMHVGLQLYHTNAVQKDNS